MTGFSIQLEARGKSGWWFRVIEKKYTIVVGDNGDVTCTCMWSTMQASRKKQANCKHVKKVKALLRLMKK